MNLGYHDVSADFVVVAAATIDDDDEGGGRHNSCYCSIIELDESSRWS